ncbi:hypothetical protein PIB30_054149 [Stylosanthes scabra]|uniref:Secreted protein n=1 Tax=Stylosanthes scabra TaxID=79078 RepID=A0ABU6QI65_9FABA|nr:hypothetical protein [Stylosanthes scabra]
MPPLDSPYLYILCVCVCLCPDAITRERGWSDPRASVAPIACTTQTHSTKRHAPSLCLLDPPPKSTAHIRPNSKRAAARAFQIKPRGLPASTLHRTTKQSNHKIDAALGSTSLPFSLSHSLTLSSLQWMVDLR